MRYVYIANENGKLKVYAKRPIGIDATIHKLIEDEVMGIAPDEHNTIDFARKYVAKELQKEGASIDEVKFAREFAEFWSYYESVNWTYMKGGRTRTAIIGYNAKARQWFSSKIGRMKNWKSQSVKKDYGDVV